MARQHEAEVMIAGEQLRYDQSKDRICLFKRDDLLFCSRLKLHDGKLIKERRYHLRTYPNCFVAYQLIDWLVSHKEAPDRPTALCLMQHLMDHDIVHHGKTLCLLHGQHWKSGNPLQANGDFISEFMEYN